MNTSELSRRGFLQGTGSLVIGFTVLGRGAHASAANRKGLLRVDPTAGGSGTAAWLVLTPTATTLYSGKVELGTGVQTALTQIVVEELRLRVGDVRFVQGDTRLTPSQGFTADSKTIQAGAISLRQAAATAYQALAEMAARHLHVDRSRLFARNGRFYITATATSVSYRALLRQMTTVVTLDPRAPTVPPAQYAIVGTNVARVDLPPKLTGAFRFTTDVKLTGMLHGRVLRPAGRNAAFHSIAHLSRARAIPGFVRVVRKFNFVGVVAKSEWAAARAADPHTGIAVSWSPGPPLITEAALPEALLDPANHYRAVTELNAGNVDDAFARAPRVLQERYFTPFQMHGSLGASSAVADVRAAPDPHTGIQATIWSGTQGVTNLRGALAALLGLRPAAVRVIYEEAAGGYGHNGADDAAADAALLSQAVGRPVRVQWSRQDEHGWEPLGPAQAHELKGSIDANRVTGWLHRVYSPTHNSRPSATNPGSLLAGTLIGHLPDPLPADADDASGRNAAVTYRFPNQRVESHFARSFKTTGPRSPAPAKPLTYLLPRSSALRSHGAFSSTFANESFLDELAHAGGLDPLELRVDSLSDSRARAVLDALRPAWQSRPRGGNGIGAGVAYQQYDLINAYVACYVELSVNAGTGAIRVQHVIVAHDCGLIINPDGLRHQIEGNVVHGISRAILEEVHYSHDRVTTLLWEPRSSAGAYPVIRFNEVPKIDCILINRPDEPALGAGEPTLGTVGAAIANAVFAATGARVRRLPMTPERVKATLTARRPGPRH